MTNALKQEQEPVPPWGREGAVLPDLARADAALFLDIDGTMLDIAPAPDAVPVPPALALLLERISGLLCGAVAIVTGRRIADADSLLAPLRLITAGVHGAELRLAPGGETITAHHGVPFAPEKLERAMHRISPHILVENKGAGVAVHYRNVPAAKLQIEAEVRRFAAAFAPAFAFCPGRMVCEVRPAGCDKGGALETISRLPAFRSRRPVMIGDDASDEPAFAAAVRLGGFGLKVAGEHFPHGEAHFGSPGHFRAWLAALPGRLEHPAAARPAENNCFVRRL